MLHMGPADSETCPINVSVALHWPLKTPAAQALSGYESPSCLPQLFLPPEATGVRSVDSRGFPRTGTWGCSVLCWQESRCCPWASGDGCAFPLEVALRSACW